MRFAGLESEGVRSGIAYPQNTHYLTLLTLVPKFLSEN
jgi:hypothetical protein